MSWLDSIAGTISTIAVALLVVLNTLFAGVLLLRRDRRVVNRWTRPLVVTDAVLLGLAVGAPVVGMGLKLAAKGLVALGALPARLLPVK